MRGYYIFNSTEIHICISVENNCNTLVLRANSDAVLVALRLISFHHVFVRLEFCREQLHKLRCARGYIRDVF